MATCAQCKYYDFTDENSYGECLCSEKYHYYPRSSCACYSFEEREDNGGGCFITTVVVNTLGFGDKCEHLQKLRAFRDNHMKPNPKLQPLLAEYNTVGPKIADAIRKDPEKNCLAHQLLDTYIKPVCNLLDANKHLEAVELYKQMVVALQKRYSV